MSAAPACTPEGKTTTEAASETSTTSGTTMTGSTTEPTGSTSPTTTGGEEVPNCKAIADEATCDAEPLCFWPPELESCTADCEKITDEMVCGTQQFCFWENNACVIHII